MEKKSLRGCHLGACLPSDPFRGSPGSIAPQAPMLGDSWILGTSPGMTSSQGKHEEERTMRKLSRLALGALFAGALAIPAAAEDGVTDTEIVLGSHTALSGP